MTGDNGTCDWRKQWQNSSCNSPVAPIGLPGPSRAYRCDRSNDFQKTCRTHPSPTRLQGTSLRQVFCRNSPSLAIAAEIHPASGSPANFRCSGHHPVSGTRLIICLRPSLLASRQPSPPPSRQTSPASCNPSGTAMRHRGACRRGKCSRWTLFGSIGNTEWPSIASRLLLVFPMNCRNRHTPPALPHIPGICSKENRSSK